MPKSPPKKPLREAYQELRNLTSELAARSIAKTADIAADQVWKHTDGSLVRITAVETDGSVIFRCIHRPPGLEKLPYDNRYRLPAYQRFILATKISD